MLFKDRGDGKIWYRTFNGSGWTGYQKGHSTANTGARPAVAFLNRPELGQRLLLAWKGFRDDNEIYYSMFDGSFWTPEEQIFKRR